MREVGCHNNLIRRYCKGDLEVMAVSYMSDQHAGGGCNHGSCYI